MKNSATRMLQDGCSQVEGSMRGMLGYSPVVPSKYGNRYAYGHVREEGRDLIISGGLGCSIMPMRLGVPPEIVELDLGTPV